MSRTFRFPIPREERLLILAAVVLAPVILAVLVAMLNNLATANGMSLVELLNRSQRLRAALAGMALIYLLATYALVAFARVKNRTRLIVGEAIRFVRPGAPFTDWFARDVTLEAARIDHFSIERVRRGAVERVELTLSAGRDEIRVNLGHAVEGDQPAASSALPPRASWRQHALVGALEQVVDMEPGA